MRFLWKIELNLPRHVRDEVVTRTCRGLRTYVMRSPHVRVEVFLYKRLTQRKAVCRF